MRGFNYKKSVQALNLLALKNGGLLNKMKAIKLIWLSDRLHLRKYGRTISGDVYFAMKLGPVASTTRNLLERSILSEEEQTYVDEFLSTTRYFYKSIQEPYLRVFSDTDIEILEEIYSKYQHLDQFQLSELSHLFPEWKKYEAALNQGIYSRFEISINDFFVNVDDQYGLFLDNEDYLQLSKEIFEQDSIF